MKLDIIHADWPAVSNITAFTTTRSGGYSTKPYDSLNLALHVEDHESAVIKNRNLLINELKIPNQPAWLQQTHSTIAVEIDDDYQLIEADASYTRQANQVCVVMTADCLPLLVCNRQGNEVAAIHAGWQGLAAGVIESCINQLHSATDDLYVWLGPAIGPEVFEVGTDVYQLFTDNDSAAKLAFTAIKEDKWLANIYQLATQRLHALGIEKIYGGNYCTLSDSEHFYSYRRDGVTGRMASLIYFSA